LKRGGKADHLVYFCYYPGAIVVVFIIFNFFSPTLSR
jgi:hypothetical protein